VIEILITILLVLGIAYFLSRILKNLLSIFVIFIILAFLVNIFFPNSWLAKITHGFFSEALNNLVNFGRSVKIINVTQRDGKLKIVILNELDKKFEVTSIFVDNKLINLTTPIYLNPNAENEISVEWKGNFSTIIIKYDSKELIYRKS